LDRQLDSEVIASLAVVMKSRAQEVTAAIDAFTGEANEFQILTRQCLVQVTEHLRKQKPETPVVIKSSFTDAAKERLVQLKREREEAVRDLPTLLRKRRHID
jgi:hypothetical protein